MVEQPLNLLIKFAHYVQILLNGPHFKKYIYIIIIIIIQTLKALVSHFYLFNIFSFVFLLIYNSLVVLIAFKVYIQENILVILFSLKLFYFPKTNAFFFFSF